MSKDLGLSDHLTHRGNLRHTRYGWLRLTPAYSVNLVKDLISSLPRDNETVLDPFCGTGTTALVCSEHGIPADTLDINPFLVWLASVKTRSYSEADIEPFVFAARQVVESLEDVRCTTEWLPPLHQISKWWDNEILQALGRAKATINRLADTVSENSLNLLKVSFCRTLIETANVSFAHQSMSFKKPLAQKDLFPAPISVTSRWLGACKDIAASARSSLLVEPQVSLSDSRRLSQTLPAEHYTCVITSPPYPNRMSYIRELRPYMFWLGYLQNGRDAGEMDWQAIGGTWGCATSNLSKWSPNGTMSVPTVEFETILSRIAAHSELLSRYVQKYFHDMTAHISSLFNVVRSGGRIHYVVGNSKFYDVMLPVERIFAAMFHAAGFEGTEIKPIRKRTSKKELYEYIVSARKP